MSRKTIFLLIIVGVALLVRMLSYSGYSGNNDDRFYAEIANQMSRGQLNILEYNATHSVPVFPLRVGLYSPAAFLFRIIGINEVALILYPFLISLASVILVFCLARTIFSEHAGLLAAAIYALLPIDTRSASILLPDLPAAFWGSLGILCLLWGSRNAIILFKTAYGLLAGFSFGLSWLCKESILFLLPFTLFYLIWLIFTHKQNVSLLFSFSLIVIITVIAECCIYYSSTGDFFYRFHTIERNYEILKHMFFSEDSVFGWQPGRYWNAILSRIFKIGPKAIFLDRNFGYVNIIAILAIGYALWKKLPTFLFPSLWFISLVIAFNFGTSSFRFYRPLVLFDRYLYPLFYPSVILTAGLLSALFFDLAKQKRFWGCVLLILIFFISLRGIYWNMVAGVQCKVERRVARIVSPDALLYTDWWTAFDLLFFWKYPINKHVVDFIGMGANDIPKGSYVLLNRNVIEQLTHAMHYIKPKFYDNAPDAWLLKWSGNGSALYLVR
jgi:4-amino-4-deoxy-L-arabinose transferase-like glycosyltransferase